MSGAIRPITMPKWGLSMKEGKVADWLVEEGEEIAPGDELVDVETEKISSAVEAADGGLLRRQVGQPGEVLSVGALLGVIAAADTPDSEIDAFITEFQASYVPPAEEEGEEGPATETVELDGRALRYLVRGEGGVPAILIHGFGGDLNNWLFNHEALAAKRTVYALDLPGHGGSAKQVGDGTLDEFAQTLGAFMDALDLAQAHLVAHSLGGAVAIAFAQAHPGRVASLTLIASAGLGTEINGEYITGFIEAERRKEIKPHLEKLFADPSLVNRQLVNDILAYKRLDGVAGALRTIAEQFCPGGVQATVLRDELAGLSLPVLVVWGAQDQIVPVAHADGLPAGIKTVIIPDAGHMPQMEAASEVNRLIDELIE